MRDQTLKRRDLNTSHTLGWSGRNNSESRNGSSGHVRGSRPGQTRKKSKDLSPREREERGCGDSLGRVGVCMMCKSVIEEGGDEKSVGSKAPFLLSYTLRYVSLADLGRLCHLGCYNRCTCVHALRDIFSPGGSKKRKSQPQPSLRL
jgi:hypothetical protein